MKVGEEHEDSFTIACSDHCCGGRRSLVTTREGEEHGTWGSPHVRLPGALAGRRYKVEVKVTRLDDDPKEFPTPNPFGFSRDADDYYVYRNRKTGKHIILLRRVGEREDKRWLAADLGGACRDFRDVVEDTERNILESTLAKSYVKLTMHNGEDVRDAA